MLASSADLANLLIRVAKGDDEAFAVLYGATSMKLFGVIFRILRQQELAEEILQEVYLKIWNRASDFEIGRASPITWMATIARNRALDEVRKRRPATVAPSADMTEVADSAPLADVRLEKSDDLRRLEACLDELDEKRGAVVRLAYIEGLSRQELADRLECPVGTIKSWLRRSLMQLKDCLGS